jgi:hypothetical protein
MVASKIEYCNFENPPKKTLPKKTFLCARDISAKPLTTVDQAILIV